MVNVIKVILRNFAFLFSCASVSVLANAAPVYVTGGEKLLGVNNIEISGLGTWNVTFVEGTSNTIFGGGVADFDFHSSADAIAASDALMNVLTGDLGHPGWDINTEYYRPFGCSPGAPGLDSCEIMTPFDIFYVGSGIDNFFSLNGIVSLGRGGKYTYLGGTIPVDMDTSPLNNFVFANWFQNKSTVSEPGTAALMMLSVVGLVLSQRRRQEAAQ